MGTFLNSQRRDLEAHSTPLSLNDGDEKPKTPHRFSEEKAFSLKNLNLAKKIQPRSAKQNA